MTDLYENRLLSDGYPDMERLAFEQYSADQGAHPDDEPRLERVLRSLSRLVTLDGNQKLCNLGCGPVPQPVRILRRKGLNAFEGFVDLGRSSITFPLDGDHMEHGLGLSIGSESARRHKDARGASG